MSCEQSVEIIHSGPLNNVNAICFDDTFKASYSVFIFPSSVCKNFECI